MKLLHALTWTGSSPRVAQPTGRTKRRSPFEVRARQTVLCLSPFQATGCRPVRVVCPFHPSKCETFMLTAIVLLWNASPAQAGRPLVVDDAAAVDPQTFELEVGVNYFRTDTPHNYDFPIGLTYGLVRSLEIGAGFGGRIEAEEHMFDLENSHSGLGDLVLGAKWNPLSEPEWFLSQALVFTAKLPTADDDLGAGQPDFDLTYIASKTLSESWSVHFNAGYTWIGDTDGVLSEDIFHAGLAGGWLVSERVELVGELYTDVLIGRERDSALAIAGGVRWNAFDSVILDALAGCGLAGEAPDWRVAAGLTWSFDFKRNVED